MAQASLSFHTPQPPYRHGRLQKKVEECYERAKQMAKQEDLWALMEMAQTWKKLADLHELSQRLKSSGVLLEKLVLRVE